MVEGEQFSQFSYKTWLRCVALTHVPCGHTRTFDSRRHDGSVADMSEMAGWMNDHLKACRMEVGSVDVA